MSDEEVCNPPRPKRSKHRPFAIECRYSRMGVFSWSDGKWRMAGRYETAKQRDEALRAKIKGASHGFPDDPTMEFRPVDLDTLAHGNKPPT